MFTKTQAFPGENFYTQVPTHWLRDPRLPATAKAVLSYWQSHAVGYRVTVEQTIAEMREQKAAIYAAVKAALDLGYLERHQPRDAKGRTMAVEYTYGPAAYAQQYVRNWGNRSSSEGSTGDATADQPAEPVDNSVDHNRAPANVSAGQTGYRFSASGQAASGQPASGRTASGRSASGESDTKKNNPLEEQSLSNCSSEKDQKTAPSGTTRKSLPRDVEAEPEGEEISDSEKELLNAAAERALNARSGRNGWSHSAIVTAMQAQLAAGHSPARVAGAIVAVAADLDAHKYPARIEFVLNAPTPRPETSASTGQGQRPAEPARYLEVGAEACKRHRGEPAEGCGRCAAEQKGAQVDADSVLTGPRMDGASARELARANAARGATTPRVQRGPWVPGPATSPDSMASLNAALVTLVDAQLLEAEA